ncbi:MAG: hypothetical protein QM677_02530 [Microbacterium sp.]
MARSDRSGWQASLPSRWLNNSTYRCLSVNAWALHSWALVWCVSQENDGSIGSRDLPFIASPMLSKVDAEGAANELVETEIWERVGSGYQIIDWGSSQVTAAEIEAKRNAWRKQNNARSSKARQEIPHEKPAFTGVVEGGYWPSNGTLQERQERQERQGRQIPAENESENPDESESVTCSMCGVVNPASPSISVSGVCGDCLAKPTHVWPVAVPGKPGEWTDGAA